MAPEVHLTLTGRTPDWVVHAAPQNCTITGWLSRPEYESLLSGASGVVCLTSRELTMQMGAFEALEHGVPMLASGTEVLRDYLDQGGVVFAEDHEPGTLAAGLRELWRERERLMAEALVAQRAAFERAERELSELRAALDGDHIDRSDDAIPSRGAFGALAGERGVWARRLSAVVLLTLLTRLVGEGRTLSDWDTARN